MNNSDRRNFKVLLLEDDSSVARTVEQFDGMITWVNNLEDGKTEILLGFYDLAIVDVTLLKKRDGKELASVGGFDCCRWLREFLPSCERVIWSKNGLNDFPPSDLMQEGALHVFFPGSPLVTSVIKKTDHDDSLENLVNLRFRFWEKERASLNFVLTKQSQTFKAKLHDWYNAIQPETLRNLPKPASSTDEKERLKEVKMRLKRSLADETEYLIEHLCGQRPIHELPLNKMLELNAKVEFTDPSEKWDFGSEKLVDELEIYELPKQGRSSAMTFCARPTLFGMTTDVWLLIKVDLKERIEQEVQNYERYWKFVVGRSRRTELLGSAIGSRLGAICYVFVGEEGKQPEPIGFENFANPSEIGKFISKLFKTRDLHRVTSADKKRGPIGYFNDRFGKKDWPKLWVDTLAIAASSVDLDFSSIGDQNPTEQYFFARSHPLTLSHGDLHFGNIIVANVDSFLLIDYRDSGWCPRTLDYVFLEASLRTEFARVATKKEDILAANRRSMKVFGDFWNSPVSSTNDNQPNVDETQTGISSNSQILNAGVDSILRFLKKSFQDVDDIEYATIALGWSLILSANNKLNEFERLATSLWSISLGKYLIERSE